MIATMSSPTRARKTLKHPSRTALLLALLVLIGVGGQLQTAAAQETIAASHFQVLLNQTVGADGNLPTDPSAPLYINTDPLEAILTPDGVPVTFGQWHEVNGAGHITRTPEGTEVSLELTGLIPNGVYTAWSIFYSDTPFNFSPFPNLGPDVAGAGALGAIDGSENTIDVDENGMSTYVGTVTPGPLSLKGEASLWTLDGHSSFVVFGVYHNDGQPHGPVQGPHHANAFSIAFVPEPSSLVIAVFGASALSCTVAFRRIRSRVCRPDEHS